MKDKTLQPLVWLGNIFIISLLLYMVKSSLRIDINPNCHAEEWIFGSCKSQAVENENRINLVEDSHQ
ncbi:hypothetical protein [Gloeothece verrucosa]|uniref:Uncharacterized protein n=1 Tax=Gloeothece verrucosa (strain PCC 7822) TaxID=497965 RepID=E0U7I3_GLOV7|nr:hypothetical protein [Gloeothece verrucosa]ADN13679.1 hypothetical protein Cyan7822_1690 [Gloeothece verrucosa PCC 7822]